MVNVAAFAGRARRFNIPAGLMSVSRHISPLFFFLFSREYWEYDKLPVLQPAEFLWGEGSVALESPHGNWGDNTWRRLFITERRCTAATLAHHAYSLFTFFTSPLPALVCCYTCNSIRISKNTTTYCSFPDILLCFCIMLQLTHHLPGCTQG